MSRIETIKQAIMADPQNKEYTEKGIEPLFAAPKSARINIIGQAPDLPPRKGFAEKWHPQLLKECPDIELTLLIGQYAQAYYLHEKVSGKVTERVHHFKDYLPTYFPLVHPSPRNQIWMAKNPWFEAEVVPELQSLVQEIIQK